MTNWWFWASLVPFSLGGEHLVVEPAPCEQPLVRAVLDDPSFLHYQDPIGQPCRAEAVRDQDGGAAGGDLHEPLVQRLFLQRVDRGSGLIEEDHVVLAKQAAGDRDPLPLPER